MSQHGKLGNLRGQAMGAPGYMGFSSHVWLQLEGMGCDTSSDPHRTGWWMCRVYDARKRRRLEIRLCWMESNFPRCFTIFWGMNVQLNLAKPAKQCKTLAWVCEYPCIFRKNINLSLQHSTTLDTDHYNPLKPMAISLFRLGEVPATVGAVFLPWSWWAHGVLGDGSATRRCGKIQKASKGNIPPIWVCLKRGSPNSNGLSAVSHMSFFLGGYIPFSDSLILVCRDLPATAGKIKQMSPQQEMNQPCFVSS